MGDHRPCKAKQAFSPTLTAISRGPKKAAQPLYSLSAQSQPAIQNAFSVPKQPLFKGMKKDSFNVPVNGQISENQLLIQGLRPFPKFLSSVPKFSQVDTGLGRLHHKFLWLWLPCLAGV